MTPLGAPPKGWSKTLLLGPGLGMLAVLATTSAGWQVAMPWALPLWLAAGLGWAWATTRMRGLDGRGVLLLILLGAVGLRGAALIGDPGLSDDRHRYVWEGAQILEGVSPWAFAPSAPERAAERERYPELYLRINHPDVSAAYPPVTQAAAAGVVLAAGGAEAGGGRRAAYGMRLFFAFADLLVLLPLGALLLRRRLPLGGLAIWAWSPLVALEFGGSGHFDSLGILLLVTATLGFERSGAGRLGERTGWLCLVAAFFVKFLPGPLFLFALRDSRRRVRGLLLAGLAAAAICAPVAMLEGGFRGATQGLSEYASRWEAGSLVFRHIEPLFTELGGFDRFDGSWEDPRRLARLAVAGVFGLVLVILLWRRARFARAAFVLIGAFLVLTPTLHPWYLCWLVPFLALYPSRAWTLLMVVAPLLYWPVREWQLEQVWYEPAWIWPVMALPFLVLLSMELYSGMRSRPSDGETA